MRANQYVTDAKNQAQQMTAQAQQQAQEMLKKSAATGGRHGARGTGAGSQYGQGRGRTGARQLVSEQEITARANMEAEGAASEYARGDRKAL